MAASLLTMNDILDVQTVEIAAAMASPPHPDSPVNNHVAELLALANVERPASLENLFAFISTARGLHEAARNATDPSWAEALHCLAQDFLDDATAEVAALTAHVAWATMGEPH